MEYAMAQKSKHFKVMNCFPKASVGQVSIPADGGMVYPKTRRIGISALQNP